MSSESSSESRPFLKGHGTENDFVLLPDLDGTLHADLSPERVRALCDRRAGIGGDGVLRVVRSEQPGDAGAEWFMDYRNSDGSVSEMCGNGVRVFGRYLATRGLVDASVPVPVATRAGTKVLTFAGGDPEGEITVDMGPPEVEGDAKISVVVEGVERSWSAAKVSMGNPHAVVLLEEGSSLDDVGSLLDPPRHDAEDYPDGVNVEFVVRRGPRHVAMRVHERGSGETRSCGTGA